MRLKWIRGALVRTTGLLVVAGLPVLALASACTTNEEEGEQTPPLQRVVQPPGVQGSRADDDNTQIGASSTAKCEELGTLTGTSLRAILADETQSVTFPLANRPLPSRLAVVAVGAPSELVGKTVALGAAENANYASCTRCLVIAIGCGATDCDQAAWFFPRSGAATFTAVASGRSERGFDGKFDDVILEQVKIDPNTMKSTPVAGGACLHVQALSFESDAEETSAKDAGVSSTSTSSSGAPPSEDAGTGTSSGTGSGGGGGGNSNIKVRSSCSSSDTRAQLSLYDRRAMVARFAHAGRSLALMSSCIALMLACRTAPAPLGEALLVVDTDVAVPSRIDRLRIEVLTSSGALVESRDVVTARSEDWPVSFSVVAPDGAPEQDVIVRLRAYPEGHQVSARELERLARATPRNIAVYASIDEACLGAPKLVLGQPLTLRRGAAPITTLLTAQGCTDETRSGSVVAVLEIAEAGDYKIEIVRATPNAANGEVGSDTAISIRTDCLFPTTQLACAEQIGIDNNRLSRIDRLTLAPGKYFVVTGGADPAPADLTLLASRLDVFQSVPGPAPPLSADPAAFEPAPGVTIDRLLVVRLRAGDRGVVPIVLRGECFGTSSDAASDTRASCIDRAGERVPVQAATVEPLNDLDAVVSALPRPAPWFADAPSPCATPPRPEGPLLDAEVCIPGGAFILGDTLALEDLERRSQPERMRAVEPFLLDKYEMTVGRFRDAVRRGFVSPDASPVANPNAALDPKTSMCTWSAGATPDTPAPGVEREALPLVCVSWSAARAVCRFLGGDLPEEDQWEFAATRAGRPIETPYPWGDALPACDRPVYGRTGAPNASCAGLGPLAVNDPLSMNDVTSLGVVGLGGNVEELLATPFVSYSDVAWQRAGLRGLVEEKDAPLRAARGADWSTQSLFATGSTRRAEPVIATYTNVGFRCARRGALIP